MKALDIAGTSIRRVTRDRTALFFLIVLPIVVIVIIGVTVRGFSTFRVGVVDLGAGAAGRQVTAAMTEARDLSVRHYVTVSSAAQAVATGEISAAVVLPAHMDPDLRAGRNVAVGIISERTNTVQQAAVEALTSVVSHQGSRVQAAQFAAAQVQGTTFNSGLAWAIQLQHSLPALGITSHPVVSTANVLPEGFDYSAPTELVLFVFLSALAGGAHIIDSRRLGIYERVAAAPVSAGSVILGEMLGFAAIAVMQSLLIVGVGALVFGVSWGNPLAAGVLLAVWALVGAAAGMLSGTLFRTPEQASAIGPVVGIGFAMLGGCMWPLALVSNVMREVGHITPHAWAVDAWTALLARHGGLGSIGFQLAILVGFAAGFALIATTRFRRLVATR
ncbi:MAG TPA: ABC transporter permease [Actinomycetota bacterium]|nr:ABC transporter permease [Actinomycetota bacterium]